MKGRRPLLPLREPPRFAAEYCGHAGWDGDRPRRLVAVDSAADGGHTTLSEFSITAGQPMGVGDALLANPFDGDFDLYFVFKPGRSTKIARCRDAWPADFGFVVAHHDAQPQMAQQLVFRLFHIKKERREMDNPGGVGFDEFHAARRGEPDRFDVHVEATRRRRAAMP